jgi:hypothetical protein
MILAPGRKIEMARREVETSGRAQPKISSGREGAERKCGFASEGDVVKWFGMWRLKIFLGGRRNL